MHCTSLSIDCGSGTMQVTVNCPQCARQLRLPREVLGSLVRCPMCQTSFQTRATANEGAEAIPPIPKPPILDAVRADTPPAPRLSLDDDIPVAPLLRDDIPVAPRLPERHDLDET